MTMVRSEPRPHSPIEEEGGPGERLRRLRRRQRRLHEEMLAVLVLLIALAITVTVLAMQWLNSGPSTAGAPEPPAYTLLGGPS